MKIGVLQRQLRRGWIIQILNFSNGPTNDKLIQSALCRAGHEVTMPTLHADLEYLRDKGYIKMTEPADMELPFPMLVADLTVKAIDLIEGSIEEIGIKFGHRD